MFYTQTFRVSRENNSELSNNAGELFVLTKDNWNDYGYETTFYLDYWKGHEFFEIGLIRILHYTNEVTRLVIPDKFESLTSDYISLGYNQKFYKRLIKILGRQRSKEILIKLNDISIVGLEKNPKFNLENRGIQDSFFRSSEGRFLYSDVYDKYFLDKESQDRDYDFSFKAKLYSEDEDFKDIEINFRKQDRLPNRLFTIVGKNGVGKTRLLNQLAESLFDSSKPENKNRFLKVEKSGTNDLDRKIPIYNKIIAISFSVFDKFYKGSLESEKSSREYQETEENLTKFNNYTYIGLHKVDNSIYSSEELVEINKRAYRKIIDKNREQLFIESINSSNILNFQLADDFNYENFFSEIFSSGQSIFISMLCRLLSEIEDGSLIFLDEPELYLHPNAIANLARLYYEILEQFKSYAILCTHSPILVQEIPSRYVRKLSLIDENTIVYNQPSIETFGTNISEITVDIFNVLDNESLYRSQLIKWAKELTEDEIINLFENNLSFKTQLYISSLYGESESN
ncbi:AAA family ATPase [Alkalihalobacillus sp. MEB130]|uniref:AAA family ATPase n=1 Tax=Alkalihalobacillus sp. MEB130 TaxID=2976704 RepID=UPI0028DEEAB0|nr:AAA family ATPase [Alkalihalobacillus sp. MEB130]MDT8860990.1 AAA family ATPase [Alkalihalobacillus sp. MEB130]